jgi:hypothetical protein
MLNTGMSKKEFDEWKAEWYIKIPGCKDFACVHELTACGIDFLCGDCSIYQTYKTQEVPMECSDISCQDCFLSHSCDKKH